MTKQKYILAFDTSNETIAVGIGKVEDKTIAPTCSYTGITHRQSNTSLLPKIDEMLMQNNIKHEDISYVASGIGPGSFTGVRISLATAKGIATALQIPLIPFNTLDAVAWRLWMNNIYGHIYVVADAMRQEIYPALYESTILGVKRLSPDKVMKAKKAADEALDLSSKCKNFIVAGDALHKYYDYFKDFKIANQEDWVPSGLSILKTCENIKNWSILPGQILPVYTRLSDAEENERLRNASISKKNLVSGVQDLVNSQQSIKYIPLEKDYAQDIAELEKQLMARDVWSANQIIEELNQDNRSWWIALVDNKVIAYAGAMHIDNKMELLKLAVHKNYQHKGIARKLLSLVSNDMRDLGAKSIILELRESNKHAYSFYEKLGIMQIAVRKKYYSNVEDAIIMTGSLPISSVDVAGMKLLSDKNTKSKDDNSTQNHPIIFAVESSCDETACAISCNSEIISDVVASQIDFHKRFGGVVPEIASRKHIEAICGVAEECISRTNLNWTDIDAVAVTYAPGLVGALVVGMAFAKGLAFALNKKIIGVNHLEGHLYANKLAKQSINFPAIASIISGGNTLLMYVEEWGKYETLGTTIDDAVGEAFDKIAKYLNLGYPGGPIISKIAKNGNPNAIKFPRAMINTGDYKFSLSGLKTAVITYIDANKNNEDFCIEDLCASFEQAIIDVQVYKARMAIKEKSAKTFMFGGGVAANSRIRSSYEKMCDEEGIQMVMAPLSACGDNAAMIALVANDRYKQKKFFSLSSDVEAHANLDIDY